MHDLVISGGTVVDGTGAPAVNADVCIAGGHIRAVGKAEEARVVLDATGCIVTPGFIDPHTHLDAQLLWDPSGAPSACHGVTTVVLSSCGFGVAPCPPGGGDYLLRSLEVVEEIPFESTRLAVPFSWSTWGEYHDTIATLPLGVNVAGFVPHSALRWSVLGERALAGPATRDERRRLVDALERALNEGAVGFSSSRGPNHVDALGNPVPSRFADDVELADLVGACEGRVVQINLQHKLSADASEMLREIERYVEMTGAAGATLSWTPFFVQSGNPTWREVLEHNRQLVADGARVVPQVAPQPITTALGFDHQYPLMLAVKGWAAALEGFFDLDSSGRINRLREADFRAALTAAGTRGGAMLDARFDAWTIAASPSRPDLVGEALSTLGHGASGVAALCDLVIADELATILHVPLLNDDFDAVCELVNDPTTLIGLGDAGAHVRSLTNYAYPTYVLAHLVRDHQRMDLVRAIHRMTDQPAQLFGMKDRGVLERGRRADVCVIDLDVLALPPSEIVRDLPGGFARLHQAAVGYRAIFLNGVQTVANDRFLGVGPGQRLPR